MVLDVKDYLENHPGGKFLIEHTIGTDISKFFYGGYSLDQNIEGIGKRHNHSNASRVQVNTMAIARLVPNSGNEGKVLTLATKITKETKVNSATKTLTFDYVTLQP